MCNSNPFGIAILGAGGIGKIQARTFHALGARIVAVLGSRDESAAEAAQLLGAQFGYSIASFSQLEELLNASTPNAVSICTPHPLHFEQTMAVLDHGLPVFCEKPLFWHEGLTQEEMERRLEQLASHPNRRLFVNTSNASYIDEVNSRLPATQSIRTFSFQFFTQGLHRGLDIGVDLLPHGLSLLLRLFGQREVVGFHHEVNECLYRCGFQHGNCQVKFEFKEAQDGPKKFAFAVNGREFERVQQGQGETFQVLLRDGETGELLRVQNPMEVYVDQFMKYCLADSGDGADGFEEAAANLRLMCKMLL